MPEAPRHQRAGAEDVGVNQRILGIRDLAGCSWRIPVLNGPTGKKQVPSRSTWRQHLPRTGGIYG